MPDLTKSPRLYVDRPLAAGSSLAIDGAAHHYLKNVMRLAAGSAIRLFNGRDGEFAAIIESIDKKAVSTVIRERLRPQAAQGRAVHLLFAPLKKERMDFLIEKAVELGATHIHPVLTQNTDMRKINAERLAAQIVEAAEQCERLDVPVFLPPRDLFAALAVWDKDVPLFAALERRDTPALNGQARDGDAGVLIGPSGGFTEDEKEKLTALGFVRPVSLGHNILRSETAAAAALSLLTL